jgi:DNA-binding transcriptional regulator YbjK
MAHDRRFVTRGGKPHPMTERQGAEVQGRKSLEPRRGGRDRVIADTAIEVLAQKGMRGLTHRAVDQEASFPLGTTSYYFRTRQALLEAAGRRVLEIFYEEYSTLQRQSKSPSGLVGAVAMLIRRGEGRSRSQMLARFELGLEASRNPAIARVLSEIRAKAVECTGQLLREVDPDISDRVIDILNSMIVGVLFERVSLGVPHASANQLARFLVSSLEESGSAQDQAG